MPMPAPVNAPAPLKKFLSNQDCGDLAAAAVAVGSDDVVGAITTDLGITVTGFTVIAGLLLGDTELLSI